MDKIWGKLKEPVKLTVTADNLDEDKSSIRQKVWECLEKNDIANFPRPVYNRIPNFKGANIAGQKVIELEEFKKAKIIKVNPDKPQEEVRYQVLDHDKGLIVPTPRLSKGLFNRLSSEPGKDKDHLRKLASREGIDKMSKPVPMASRIKVDLVVVGSVAVDRLGRRIGKGEGFADLEFAMAASHHGAVNADTIIVTTVHDVQVFEKLPEKLFESHDIPVDIIVTPTEVIRVDKRLPKPDHIIWNILTRQKFEQIPILREIQFKEHKAGTNVQLKDETSEDLSAEPVDKVPKKLNNKKKQQQPKQNANEEDGSATKKVTTTSPKKPKQYAASICVFIGKIPRGTRVKELKDVIIAKGIKPINILWKGGKGYALIYCEKKEITTSEQVCDKLKDLKIGDNVLNVEPDKREMAKKADSKGSISNGSSNGVPSKVENNDSSSN